MPVARLNREKLIGEEIVSTCVDSLRVGAEVPQDIMSDLDNERIIKNKKIIIEGYPLEQLFGIAYGNAMYALQIFGNQKFHRYFTQYQQAKDNIWSDESLNLSDYIPRIRKRYRRSLMLLDAFENNVDAQYLQNKGKTLQQDNDTLLTKYVLDMESASRARHSKTAESNLFYLLQKKPDLTMQSIYSAISAENARAVALADKNYLKLKALSETTADINALMVTTIEKQMSDNRLNEKTMAVFVNIGNLNLINDMLNPNIFYRLGKKIFKNIITLGFSNNTDTAQVYVNAKDIIARISAEFATPEIAKVNIEQKLKLIETFLERRFIVGTEYWREADDDCWKTLFQILPNINHAKRNELDRIAKGRYAVARNISLVRIDGAISNLLNSRPVEQPAADLLVNEHANDRRQIPADGPQLSSGSRSASQQQPASHTHPDNLVRSENIAGSLSVHEQEHEEEHEEEHNDAVVVATEGAIIPQTAANQSGQRSTSSGSSTNNSRRVASAQSHVDPFRTPTQVTRNAPLMPRALFQSPQGGSHNPPAQSSVGPNFLFLQNGAHEGEGDPAVEEDYLDEGFGNLYQSPTLATRVNEEDGDSSGDEVEVLEDEQLPQDEALADATVIINHPREPDTAAITLKRNKTLTPKPLSTLSTPVLKQSAQSSPTTSIPAEIPATLSSPATLIPPVPAHEDTEEHVADYDDALDPPPSSSAAAKNLQERKPDTASQRVKTRTPKPMSALGTPILKRSAKNSPKTGSAQTSAAAPQPLQTMLIDDESDGPILVAGAAPMEIQQPPLILTTRLGDDDIEEQAPTSVRPLQMKVVDEDEDEQSGEVIELNQTADDDLPLVDLTPASRDKLNRMEAVAKKALTDNNEVEFDAALYEASPSAHHFGPELSPGTNGNVKNFLKQLHATLRDSELPRSPARLLGSAKRKDAPLLTRLEDSPEVPIQPLSMRLNDSFGSAGSRRSPASSPQNPVAAVPKPLATKLDDSLEEGVDVPQAVAPPVLSSGLTTRLDDLDDEESNIPPPAPLVMRLDDDEVDSEENTEQPDSDSDISGVLRARKQGL